MSIAHTSKPAGRQPGGNKLHRLLGDEYADKVAADLQPWYLRPNYSPSDIIIEADGSVRGGTVAAFVERLTAHEQAGRLIQFASNHIFTHCGFRPYFQQGIPYDIQIIYNTRRAT